MADVQYCEPCQKLFSGNLQPRRKGEQKFIHHPDAISLKTAFQLPCILCSQAWGSRFKGKEILFGTWGRFSYLNDFEKEDGARELIFCYDEIGKEDVQSGTMALVPWEDMIGYELPPTSSHQTRSPSALDFLISQYHQCHERHNGCRSRQQSESFRPAKLIDVGGFESDDIHICDARDLVEKELYVCLSYTWGQLQPLLLTKATERKLRDGVAVSTLVKTFRDAILVTRKLGIRYLWIDSLCIFQDNLLEWEKEAGRMGYIYSHAACTIAATSAKDSEGGLFLEKDTDPPIPLCLDFAWSRQPSIDTFQVETLNTLHYPLEGRYWCDVLSVWTTAIEKAPLNSRAWVNQERYLSPRLMHFTDTYVFWECHEYMANERYPQGLPKWAFPYWGEDPTSLKRYVHKLELEANSLPSKMAPHDGEDLPLGMSPQTRRAVYHHWRCFRIHYSICKMSKEDDKLVAIQGIAQNIGSILGDTLVAGLWRKRLVEELCWFKHNLKDDPYPSEPSTWRAPTWSWASSNERIWVSSTSKFHRSCPDLQIWAKVHDLDVENLASGKLVHASLHIQCRPIRVTLLLDENAEDRYKVYGILTFTRSEVELRAGLGISERLSLTMDRRGCTGVHDVFLVIIQRCAHEDVPGEHFSYDEEDVVEGLMIVPDSVSDGSFTRMGIFEVKGNVYVEKMIKEHEAAEEQIITMI